MRNTKTEFSEMPSGLHVKASLTVRNMLDKIKSESGVPACTSSNILLKCALGLELTDYQKELLDKFMPVVKAANPK